MNVVEIVWKTQFEEFYLCGPINF